MPLVEDALSRSETVGVMEPPMALCLYLKMDPSVDLFLIRREPRRVGAGLPSAFGQGFRMSGR
jgi:hypothetical protein